MRSRRATKPSVGEPPPNEESISIPAAHNDPRDSSRRSTFPVIPPTWMAVTATLDCPVKWTTPSGPSATHAPSWSATTLLSTAEVRGNWPVLSPVLWVNGHGIATSRDHPETITHRSDSAGQELAIGIRERTWERWRWTQGDLLLHPTGVHVNPSDEAGVESGRPDRTVGHSRRLGSGNRSPSRDGGSVLLIRCGQCRPWPTGLVAGPAWLVHSW